MSLRSLLIGATSAVILSSTALVSMTQATQPTEADWEEFYNSFEQSNETAPEHGENGWKDPGFRGVVLPKPAIYCWQGEDIPQGTDSALPLEADETLDECRNASKKDMDEADRRDITDDGDNFVTTEFPQPTRKQSVGSFSIGDPTSIQNAGTADGPGAVAAASFGDTATQTSSNDALVEVGVFNNMLEDENGDAAGGSITIGEALDGDIPTDGTFGPLSDQGVINVTMEGSPSTFTAPDNFDEPVIVSVEEPGQLEGDGDLPSLTGDEEPEPTPTEERTILATADTFVDIVGAGDTNFDGSNDQTDLQRNLETGVTLLTAELTNADPETHVINQTINDLAGGGDDLQEDGSQLLVGDDGNNDLATDVENILVSATTAPDDGGDPAPGEEQTLIGVADNFTDAAGAGDSNDDGLNDQADLQVNMETAVAGLVTEITNADPETHVVNQTLTDLAGGGDDLAQDTGELITGGDEDNALATDVENILIGATTPPDDGGAPEPGEEQTIVGTVDEALDTLGQGDANGDGSVNQGDIETSLLSAVDVVVTDVLVADAEENVISQTLTDLAGGGDDLAQDAGELITGGDENNDLVTDIGNTVVMLTTPQEGSGNTGLPISEDGIAVDEDSPFSDLNLLDVNGDGNLNPSDLENASLPPLVSEEGIFVGDGSLLSELRPLDVNGDDSLAPSDLVSAIGPTGLPVDDALVLLP